MRGCKEEKKMVGMTKTTGYDERVYVVFADLKKGSEELGKMRITLTIPERPPTSGDGEEGNQKSAYDKYMERRKATVYADALFLSRGDDGWKESFIREVDIPDEDVVALMAMEGESEKLENGLKSVVNMYFLRNGFGMWVS